MARNKNSNKKALIRVREIFSPPGVGEGDAQRALNERSEFSATGQGLGMVHKN